jgi:ABC-2 type transport system ATP-binding protein
VLAERHLYVRELTPVQRDLESVFLELTADEHLGATGTRSSRRGSPPPDWGGS